jgi:hypothetical protein
MTVPFRGDPHDCIAATTMRPGALVGMRAYEDESDRRESLGFRRLPAGHTPALSVDNAGKGPGRDRLPKFVVGASANDR